MGRKKKKKRGFIRTAFKKIFDVGIFLLVVLVITYLLSNFVVQRYTVHNHSMEPTLMNGDNVLIDKLSYRLGEVERFDIIVFKQTGSNEGLVKRVIGLPYEVVEIRNGIIYIDGEELTDVKGLDAPEYAGIASKSVRLSEGEYFVLGDNREESIDSRYEEIGLATSTRIIGKVKMRILPLGKIKIF